MTTIEVSCQFCGADVKLEVELPDGFVVRYDSENGDNK